MKQVVLQGGHATVQEVPAPEVGGRSILVRVQYSCVSAGTERESLVVSGLPLHRRAMKRPANVKRVLALVREQGLMRTKQLVSSRLKSGTPTGYSAAGSVIAVGPEAKGFRVGDRVACSGVGIANHAEIIDVPVKLAAKVPDGLSIDAASTVSLGAIALQGVRRGAPAVGESVAVIGLGLLGQLVVQILLACGCRVIGSDPDPSRTKMALAGGMQWGIHPSDEDVIRTVQRLTDGYGADAAIVAASSSSHHVISQAMQATRRKGRVVVVGDVGLHLHRADLYEKELDFLISTSYGPGRYDLLYEEGGQDYPFAYVRWTENRNMTEYLRLLAEGKVSLTHLSTACYPVEDAHRAYQALKEGSDRPLLALLSYPERSGPECRRVHIRHRASARGRMRVALVGVGRFSQDVHLPNIAKLRAEFDLRCVMSRSGTSAKAAAVQYGATYATTDFEEVLKDPDIDLVLIATRHNLHAPMALQALRAGKHVLVEKPLALRSEELSAIDTFYRERAQGPVLMTGFNRRFAPAVRQVLQVLSRRAGPMIVNYRLNAGYVAPDHWTQTEEGGGRNLGEACHIYDLFTCLTDAAVGSVHADPINPRSGYWSKNDNFVAVVTYADGSVCTLTYTAMGHKASSKEQMDIYCDGKVIALDDYKSLTISGGRYEGWNSRLPQKGHLQELQALARCLRKGGEWPIPLWQQLQAMDISLHVERMLVSQKASGSAVESGSGVSGRKEG